MTIKKLVLTKAYPAGATFPASSVLIEPPHLRQDKTRPGDIYAMGKGMHRKDTVMDVIIVFGMQKSCLQSTAKSSDYVLREAKTRKFAKDSKSSAPIQGAAYMRFVPLAMNHLGQRRGHFTALLKDHPSSGRMPAASRSFCPWSHSCTTKDPPCLGVLLDLDRSAGTRCSNSTQY